MFFFKSFDLKDWKLTAPVWISRKKVSDSIPDQNTELQVQFPVRTQNYRYNSQSEHRTTGTNSSQNT